MHQETSCLDCVSLSLSFVNSSDELQTFNNNPFLSWEKNITFECLKNKEFLIFQL